MTRRVTAERFGELALALPGVSVAPHFDRTAYRTEVRIFATVAADGSSANLRLTSEHQEQLVEAHGGVFQPVNGAWGAQGWTTVELAHVDAALLRATLAIAHGLALERPRKARGKR